jgi:hypothetical protein
LSQAQLDAVLVVEPVGAEDQVGGVAALERRGQPDPVVGGPALLPEHDDPVAAVQAVPDGGLHEPVADHPVPDDEQHRTLHALHPRPPLFPPDDTPVNARARPPHHPAAATQPPHTPGPGP